jgi:histidinol-phosphate phosphatase family protein
VLNRERGEHTWLLPDFEVLPGVPEVLAALQRKGWLLIVVSNQSGIGLGLYGHAVVAALHAFLHTRLAEQGAVLNAVYYCPHHPSKGRCLCRKPGSLLLVDGGGQYLDGTTDVTRTMAIGEPSADQRRMFTLVLKAHIAMAVIRFPVGTSGHQLDALARAPMWMAGFDYDHGTGHGVGCAATGNHPVGCAGHDSCQEKGCQNLRLGAARHAVQPDDRCWQHRCQRPGQNHLEQRAANPEQFARQGCDQHGCNKDRHHQLEALPACSDSQFARVLAVEGKA